MTLAHSSHLSMSKFIPHTQKTLSIIHNTFTTNKTTSTISPHYTHSPPQKQNQEKEQNPFLPPLCLPQPPLPKEIHHLPRRRRAPPMALSLPTFLVRLHKLSILGQHR